MVRIDRAREQVIALPLQRIDRKEIGSAGVPGASVIGHGGMVAAAFMRRNALRLLRPTRAVQIQ
jgi:hypothetical protein